MEYYCDWSKLTSTWTKDTSVSGRSIYLAPYNWSEAVDMEFKFKSIPSSEFVGFRDKDVLPAKFLLGRYQNQWRVDYNINQSNNINPTITTSSVIKIKSTAKNSQSLYIDDTLITSKTTTSGDISLRCDVFNGSSYELDYVIITKSS